MVRITLFVNVLLLRLGLCKYLSLGDVILHLISKRAIFGPWLNQLFIYNKGCFKLWNLQEMLMEQSPLICKKVKLDLSCHDLFKERIQSWLACDGNRRTYCVHVVFWHLWGHRMGLVLPPCSVSFLLRNVFLTSKSCFMKSHLFMFTGHCCMFRYAGMWGQVIPFIPMT